ncbi:hypothetical protein F5B21DRAFT_494972 [Xylaria acuta]|nr:hypothetical protein F5B21DRAFT_494972 [Xylaria acuta]
MPYLIESIQWRLIQELGRLLQPKMARYDVRRELVNYNEGMSSRAELVEVELRQALMVEELSDNLDQKEYDECEAKLKALCSLLEGLARPRSIPAGPPAPTYPRLYALTKSIELMAGPVDLANGPNETLFSLPKDDDNLNKCLSSISEYNITFSRLLHPAVQEPTIRPLQKQKKRNRTWKKARVRNQVTFMLEVLFKHFKCGSSHEVLLKLAEDPDEHSVLPSLQIMLSLCPESESWQEAWCDSVNLDRTSISSIQNICEGLQQHTGLGKSLILLIKEYGLFGAWDGIASPETDLSSKESLHQLIVDGAFKPLDLNTLLNGTPTTKFSIQDKRDLAVKLGFCLMDFFDTDLASNRIYFLDSLKSRSRKELSYLAFNSKLPATPDSYNFGMGHPALLSFAKLLIELDMGQSMDISIASYNSQNSYAYVQLMTLVERLERERGDSYVEAIRGCLMVHYKIAKTLRSPGLEGKAADRKIRKRIYEEVVKKLELGLSEATPRSVHKRQRSISPPRPNYLEGPQAAGSREMALRPVEPKQAVSGYKRQRTWRSQLTSEMCDSDHNPCVIEEPFTIVPQAEPVRPQPQYQAYEELAGHRTAIMADPSDSWFAELANMNAVVRVKPRERDILAPRIKIAILDTGIESQHLASIEDYRDFVDEMDSPCLDTTGHGTNIFLLVRKVCEDAHYFIGRVWEGSQDTLKTPTIMEKAIDHAREVWNVDIIVLSSGFRTAHNNIGEAIERANMARILTFASPSNYGNLSDVYYPGRLYGLGKVICLFSTNSMVRSSTTKTFNPSPLDTAAHRTFAILGEDIILENMDSPLNGTSYSTAIGAGIAARILDFSRHPQFRMRIKNIDDLKKVEGMLAVFGRMAKRTDNGYRCIAPWEICPPPEEGMERREARERQQSAVFDELKEALKNIHRA